MRKSISFVTSCLAIALLGLLSAFAGAALAADAKDGKGDKPKPSYAGLATCVSCHAAEGEAWRGSHHDLAMQVASDETVLGDFNDASFSHFGVTTRFYRRGDQFFVSTEGADGKIAEFEITYTFGITPLQQYMVAFPDGRVQMLGIAWDTRPKEAGGQRWFHLYPDRNLKPGEPLHWTGIDQTWNHMCAECHSTELRKNYDPATDSYDTRWAEINVSCEACHGPGSDHVAWATAAKESGTPATGDNGLTIALNADIDAWSFETDKRIARRTKPLGSHTELNVCAKCHSRRAPLRSWDADDQNLLQSHKLQLLTSGYYFPDGQIEDEVFVLGSFLQSKMHRAGVTCSNCHDPHSLKVRAEGNALCAQCHAPEVFDTAAHHFHEAGTKGAECVSCHMPERTYMVVDPRRDHSFHVPRPDLTEKLGVPNACIGCHEDKPASWATAELATRFGDKTKPPHFGEILTDARNNKPGAAEVLAALARDENEAAIVRATALSEIGLHVAGSPNALKALAEAGKHDDPLVRLGVAEALDTTPPQVRLQIGLALLEDPMLAVRLTAAGALYTLPRRQLSEDALTALRAHAAEYEQAQLANADRPESRVNLGNFQVFYGEFVKAEQEYRAALRLDPTFFAAAVNLADLFRLQNRDEDGEVVLKSALAASPDAAEAHYALALLLVRQKRLPDALPHLQRATELRPANPRYGFTYGLALQGAGRKDAARGVFKTMLQRHPYDASLLDALLRDRLEAGVVDEALTFARRLAAVRPDDRNLQNLVRQLEAATGGGTR